MPLLNPIDPEINRVLEEAGISVPKKADASLTDKLERAGLGLEEILQELSSLSSRSDSDHLRLRAAELALKLHKVLNTNETQAPPTINIIIQSPSGGEHVNMGFLRPPSYEEVNSKSVS
jgi:hypothetical protein